MYVGSDHFFKLFVHFGKPQSCQSVVNNVHISFLRPTLEPCLAVPRNADYCEKELSHAEMYGEKITQERSGLVPKTGCGCSTD